MRVFAAAGLSLASCASAGGEQRPAVIAPDALPAVTSALATELGTASVELGTTDPLTEPLLVVLPPPLGPLETASPAAPRMFDISIDAAACYLRERGADAVIRLPREACAPL